MESSQTGKRKMKNKQIVEISSEYRKYWNGVVPQYGKVVGVAANDLPVIGRMIIVQLDTILSDDYPYSVIIIPENHLSVVEEDVTVKAVVNTKTGWY
jgi:hypothetical protein